MTSGLNVQDIRQTLATLCTPDTQEDTVSVS